MARSRALFGGSFRRSVNERLQSCRTDVSSELRLSVGAVSSSSSSTADAGHSSADGSHPSRGRLGDTYGAENRSEVTIRCPPGTCIAVHVSSWTVSRVGASLSWHLCKGTIFDLVFQLRVEHAFPMSSDHVWMPSSRFDRTWSADWHTRVR
eukprot:CAMPEP_0183827066 /NCGR_PEP_ID=MMETSP0807_2-20130328/2036_1 /TAXON_ID=88271 /ORGANISM="Picocystis salinarum, Strain CCMP1897" /LENGTH=150 /DNA_ID=CAMNT_0026072203 /DNA_START=354 /DNA_END=802 /DNA_ORIENTATION=-